MKKFNILLITLLLSGCSSAPLFTETATKRAEFDLDCNASELIIQNIGGDSYAAKGCDKKAVYNCQCTFGVALQCTRAKCEKE